MMRVSVLTLLTVLATCVSPNLAQASDIEIGIYERQHPPPGTVFRPDPAPAPTPGEGRAMPDTFFGITIPIPENIFKGSSASRPSERGNNESRGGFTTKHGEHPIYWNEYGPI